MGWEDTTQAVRRVPDAGFWVMKDQPDTIAACIVAFATACVAAQKSYVLLHRRRVRRGWQLRRLPVHYLPAVVALQERAAVQVVRDRDLALVLRRAHQAQRDDRGRAVLLDADVLGRVDRARVARLRRARL